MGLNGGMGANGHGMLVSGHVWVLSLDATSQDQGGYFLLSGHYKDTGDAFSWTYVLDGGSVTVAAVPEPASLAVLGLGALGFLKRRKRA
ncbi:PEP-CTERM sorting domain-containing protein [bacterium]|nr:MAG: PEP-CTERM sorting domain-containing protein [bacterium]